MSPLFSAVARVQHTAEQILGNCFALQIIVSLILTAILLKWNRSLLLAFGASENTIGYASSYMNIYAIGTIFVELTLGMNAFITAQGFAKTIRLCRPPFGRGRPTVCRFALSRKHMGTNKSI